MCRYVLVLYVTDLPDSLPLLYCQPGMLAGLVDRASTRGLSEAGLEQTSAGAMVADEASMPKEDAVGARFCWV